MANTERWDVFEFELTGSDKGNPFLDVEFSATFSQGHRNIDVEGFYDGGGIYKVRFMPDTTGEWRYLTRSNLDGLNGKTGSFMCADPGAQNHGPVRVDQGTRFKYEDGTNYVAVGTTCYVWNHQGDSRERQTLETLRSAPFNKMRMCVFPKHYDFNKNEPEHYPFEGTPLGEWDYDRFNPEFFRHLEARIYGLMEQGIEADLILFHPYDRWGFAKMRAEVDDRYLKYLVSRLAAFRNIWWSFANEFDLMKEKSMADWDRYFRIVQQHDHVQHLRSIHNCRGFYDHGKPWVTHCSVQHHELGRVGEWIDLYKKPVVVDECGYEGDIWHDWGNLTAKELSDRFWTGFALGGYVGHGETYCHPQDILWWSRGGELHGESPIRIKFLREVIEAAPSKGLGRTGLRGERRTIGLDGQYYLCYHGERQPKYKNYGLPQDREFRAEIIETWEMTITPVDGTFSGDTRIELPGKPYIAVKFTAVD